MTREFYKNQDLLTHVDLTLYEGGRLWPVRIMPILKPTPFLSQRKSRTVAHGLLTGTPAAHGWYPRRPSFPTANPALTCPSTPFLTPLL